MYKPKLLIFIDWYKPGFKAGGPIRSISNLVDAIADQLDIYIITRDTDYLETEPYTTIKSNQWNNIDGAKVYYLSKENQNLKSIKKLLIEVNPDQLYCNCLYSPIFTQLPLYLANKLKIKSIIAVRGMLSQGSLGVKSTKKKVFLVLAKIIGQYKNTIFHATTLDEKNDIEAVFGKATKLIVAQNLPENKHILFHEKSKENNSLKIVSIGRIAPEKNTLYAIEVLLHVKSQITLDIYGAIYKQDYWNKCLTVIKKLPSNITVNYKSILEHQKINNTLKNYHVLFLPSTGENFGHAIIEGMINSCIPVISDKTPWKNLLKQQVGFDISLDKIEDFAKTIDLISSFTPIEFNTFSKNAHHYAAKIIDDKELVLKYLELFKP